MCAVSPVTWSTNTLVAPKRVLTHTLTITNCRTLCAFIHIWDRDEDRERKCYIHSTTELSINLLHEWHKIRDIHLENVLFLIKQQLLFVQCIQLIWQQTAELINNFHFQSLLDISQLIYCPCNTMGSFPLSNFTSITLLKQFWNWEKDDLFQTANLAYDLAVTLAINPLKQEAEAWTAHHTLTHVVVWTHRTWDQKCRRVTEKTEGRKQIKYLEYFIGQERILVIKWKVKEERRGLRNKSERVTKQQSSRFRLSIPAKPYFQSAEVIKSEATQAKYEEIHNTRSNLSLPAVAKLNVRLTNTGGGLCSEAWLTLAHKAAGSVHTHISQLTATQLFEAALVHIYRGEKPRTINRKFLIWQPCNS